MAIQLEDVQVLLEPEEPDYAEAAKLGAEALPHLETLIASGGSELGAKAASLAGFIDDPGAVDVLTKAAASEDPIIRVAAAGAASNLADEDASTVLLALVDDEDLGVQMRAFKSVPAGASSELLDKTEALAQQAEFAAIAPESLTQPAEEAAPEEEFHIPELSPMPSSELPATGYSEELSADEMPGESDFSLSAAMEQEMPGSTAPPGDGGMGEREQEMPGSTPQPGDDEMGGDEQEMPEL